MSMQDPIADMFTRVRNAQKRFKPVVYCPHTKYKLLILDVLKREGYIDGYQSDELDGKPSIKIHLKYHADQPVINKISRISRSSLRVYNAFDDMSPVCNGLGVRIVSTSKGVFSDRELRKMYKKDQQKVGGEIVGEVI